MANTPNIEDYDKEDMKEPKAYRIVKKHGGIPKIAEKKGVSIRYVYHQLLRENYSFFE